jgi:hypothetical protein
MHRRRCGKHSPKKLVQPCKRLRAQRTSERRTAVQRFNAPAARTQAPKLDLAAPSHCCSSESAAAARQRVTTTRSGHHDEYLLTLYGCPRLKLYTPPAAIPPHSSRMCFSACIIPFATQSCIICSNGARQLSYEKHHTKRNAPHESRQQSPSGARRSPSPNQHGCEKTHSMGTIDREHIKNADAQLRAQNVRSVSHLV